MSTTPNVESETPATQDDLNQMMAEVKRLVEALHTLIPSTSHANPKPEPEPEPLEFAPLRTEWLDMFTPQPEIMRKALFEALLAIFLRHKEEEARPNTEPLSTTKSDKVQFPSFADKLTLLLSKEIPTRKGQAGTKELNRSKFCTPEIKSRLEEDILNTSLWDLDVVSSTETRAPITWGSDDWCWTPPPGGKLSLFPTGYGEDGLYWNTSYGGVPESRTIAEPNLHLTGPSDFGAARPGDFGALCLLQIPIRNSILEFRFIEFILAQTGFLNDETSLHRQTQDEIHLASFLCFLGTFAEYWPSAADRAAFSHKWGYSRSAGYGFNYAQIHFRYFTAVDTLEDNIGSGGLRCHRQRGEISPSSPGKAPLRFEERRVSIFGILSAPAVMGSGLESLKGPSIYRVLVLGEDDMNLSFEEPTDDSKPTWIPGWGGAVAFQQAIFLTISSWEMEWNTTLDQIDDCLSVQLDQLVKSKQLAKLMFDSDFERSRLYFTILQLLRIFGECVRAVSADLRALDYLLSSSALTIFETPEQRLAFSSNWESITKHQKDAEERLLGRLSNKTEEVKSLRDGLFNASSLLEATQATTMNRYIIIFTVVTVLYLPPSFLSTVFGMTIFQKSVDQTTREYKITTVVVSLITYLAALVSVIAVDRVHVKRIVLKWWKFMLENSPVKCNSDPVTVPEQPASPSQESRPGGNEKKSGQSNAPQDVESAIDEEAGQATKSRFSWHKKRKSRPS